ncbi:MAG TPA: hypothetical protein P5248_09970 [Bacteroidales bacterium]|nr:hypothetical protein [Bacteroidales bacterium]
MRNILAIALIVSIFMPGFGQEKQERRGTVSYVSSQHVYVKFLTTEGFKPGDVLYIPETGHPVPALEIRSLSSISVVCTPLAGLSFTVGQEVVGLVDAPQPEPAPGNEVGQTPEPLPVAGPVACLQKGQSRLPPGHRSAKRRCRAA